MLRRTAGSIYQKRWALGVWLGGVMCLIVMFLPVDSPARVVTLIATSIVATAIFLWAVLSMPRSVRQVWWWLWVYQLLTVVGDVVYDVYAYYFNEDPFPSLADVFYISAYIALITGLVMLVERRQSERNRETWIDTAVMSLAAACVFATVVIVPILNDSSNPGFSTAVALLYPLLDVVVLSALIRLLIDVKHVAPALGLLAGSIALTLTGDLAFQSLDAQNHVDDPPAWLDVLFLAGILLLTAAATSRTATSITKPSPAYHRTKARLVGLAIAALTAPTLLAISVWSEAGSGARLLALVSIAIILLILWGSLMLISMNEQQAALLADLARKDGLTGLPNRRTLDFELDRMAARCADRGTPLTVAILDLDHFKAFNDTYGHPAGDTMLIDCARAWHALLHPPAILARYGGEEFAVLLPGTDADQAHEILEQLRLATPADQTVSIGYAQHRSEEPIAQTVERADKALYAAKETGRNCVIAGEV